MGNFIPRLIFKLSGWKALGHLPPLKKYIIIGAPHTSNWDFVFGMCAWKLYNLKPSYLIKKEAYRFPFSIFLKATGAIPVDRTGSHNLGDSIVQMFRERDEFVAIISPEGTRKLVGRWKTGFYYVALQAKVPIVMGALDFGRKNTLLSKPFYPTGDIQRDFGIIREFYKDIIPKNRGSFNLENIRPD